MEQLEVVFGLFVLLVVIATLARRIKVPYPILLVVGGLVIGLLPGLPTVEPDPELVLLVFLPPLLYAAAFQASAYELRAHAAPIGLLAVGLVLVTVVGVKDRLPRPRSQPRHPWHAQAQPPASSRSR